MLLITNDGSAVFPVALAFAAAFVDAAVVVVVFVGAAADISL